MRFFVRLARLNDDQVRSEAFELRKNIILGSLSERHEQHHGADADDHSQNRQHGT
jgi:hypothetical protein